MQKQHARDNGDGPVLGNYECRLSDPGGQNFRGRRGYFGVRRFQYGEIALLVRSYRRIVILKNLEKVDDGYEFEGLNHHFGGFHQLDRSAALFHSRQPADQHADAAGVHNRYFFSIQNNLGFVILKKLIEQLLKAVGGDAKLEVSAELNHLGIALLPYANIQDRSS